MVNIWNAYQCMATFNMSRSASTFESGIGRGLGFRDSNQDLLGFVHMVPERARQRILDLAATQLESGGAYHQYQPLTKKGNNDVGGNFNDDPHWLIIGVAQYLKETGDFTILDEPVVFDNAPGTEVPLYEHLKRSIQYALDRLGPHGLPLIGQADWNDCLNLNCFSDEPGQSFQTPQGQDRRQDRRVGVYRRADGAFRQGTGRHRRGARQRATDAANYRQVAADMDKTVRAAWLGRRVVPAAPTTISAEDRLEENARRARSSSSRRAIASLPASAIDDGKARKALDSVAKHLATPHGIVLQQPAYTPLLHRVWRDLDLSAGLQGKCRHLLPQQSLGDHRRVHARQRRRARSTITRASRPSVREAISDVHRCEPYVYAQMIAGRDAPTHGEAKNSWLTGTAAWNYYAITQWILGIRPDYDGLRIAPVVPERWPGFRQPHVSAA